MTARTVAAPALVGRDEGRRWYVERTSKGYKVVFPAWSNIRLSAKQWRIIKSKSMQTLVNAGTGFGKDDVGVLKTIMEAHELFFKRRRDKDFRRSGVCVNVAICAPSKPNYKETWDKLLDMVPMVPGRAKDGSKNYKVNEREQTITLYGRRGIRFNMITLWDANNIRGQGWDLCLITEAAFVDWATIDAVVLKRVNRGGCYGWMLWISTPNNEWWDEAVESALKCEGNFDDWEVHQATSFDSPVMTAAVRDRCMKEKLGNESRYRQERLAKLFVDVSGDAGAESPFGTGVIETAFLEKRQNIVGPFILAYDLAWGGDDDMWEAVLDESTNTVVELNMWEKTATTFDPKNPNHTPIVEIIKKSHARWGNVSGVYYDATGPLGRGLYPHIPRHIQAKPITRNNTIKNTHVGSFIHRLAQVDEKGKCLALRIPDPDKYPMSDTQRKNFKRAVEQLLNYRKLTYVTEKGNTQIVYTKGKRKKDDAVDVLTIGCSALPAMPIRPGKNVGGMRRARYG